MSGLYCLVFFVWEKHARACVPEPKKKSQIYFYEKDVCIMQYRPFADISDSLMGLSSTRQYWENVTSLKSIEIMDYLTTFQKDFSLGASHGEEPISHSAS